MVGDFLINIYSSQFCNNCTLVKKYLEQKGVVVNVIFINDEIEAFLKHNGYNNLPVLEVNNKLSDCFTKEELDKIIAEELKAISKLDVLTLEKLAESGKKVDAVLSSDRDRVSKIMNALNSNISKYGAAYCPCKLDKSLKSVCPCEEFRTNKDMKKCHCGIYIRK